MSRSTRGNQSRDEPSRSSSREGNDNSRNRHDEPTHANEAQSGLSIGCRIVVEGGKYDGKYGTVLELTPQKAHLNLDGMTGTVLLHQHQLKPVQSPGRATRGNDEPASRREHERPSSEVGHVHEPTHANEAQSGLSIGCRIVVEGGKYDGKYGTVLKFTPQRAHLNLDDAEGTVLLDQTRLILVKSSGLPSTERNTQKTSKPTRKDDFGFSRSSNSSRALPLSPSVDFDTSLYQSPSVDFDTPLYRSPSVDYDTPLYRSPSADNDSPPSNPVPVRQKCSARTLFDTEDTLPRTSRSDYNQDGEYRHHAKPSPEVETKIDAFAKKIEVKEEETIQPKSSIMTLRRDATPEDRKKTWEARNNIDLYSLATRKEIESTTAFEVDHIIEIQMLDLALARAAYQTEGAVTRGQIDIIRKVVNAPEINLNVTTQNINRSKKVPITAWLSLYKSNTGSQDSPLPSLQDIVAKRYSERFKDGEFGRIQSAMTEAFIKIKSKLQVEKPQSQGEKIINGFIYELEDMIEKMQIC
eukprot:TRINITY_DN4760_c0_g2_i1.p1 TRINITY_DN4760_c0_g2~~TRINITY_DN4760_c0_g2_i1.p1  ORF type:complete len:524 (-),score=66.31 TRINITY_DN4760_c0_g2_i1:248-1819(-)